MTPNLFDRIPTTFFNPLAAPSAPVYAAVLLRLFTETQRHQQPLSRELALTLVMDILAETPADLPDIEITSDQDAPADDESDVLAARASAMLRYLATCGWLRIETQIIS